MGATIVTSLIHTIGVHVQPRFITDFSCQAKIEFPGHYIAIYYVAMYGYGSIHLL